MLTIPLKTKTAYFLGQIAIHLGFIGRFIEARDCDSDAVLLWRSLVAEDPDSHTPNLARQLTSQGTSFSNLNQHEESLDATEECITLCRSLVEKNPALYTPDLAGRIGNLGIFLSNLNRHKESLEVTQESFSQYEALVIKNPARYSSKRDAARHRLEQCLLHLGRDTKLPDSA